MTSPIHEYDIYLSAPVGGLAADDLRCMPITKLHNKIFTILLHLPNLMRVNASRFRNWKSNTATQVYSQGSAKNATLTRS